MRILVVISVILIAILATPTRADMVRMRLCIDPTTKKNAIVLHDLLELELITHADIELLNCTDPAIGEVYQFRQRVTQMEKGKPSIQVTSALMSPSKSVIFSQIELIAEPSRRTMSERAQVLAKALLEATQSPHVTRDPFLQRLPAKQQPEQIANTEERDEQSRVSAVNLVDTDTSRRSLSFFLGMEHLSQLGFTDTFLRSQELVITRSFMVLGGNYVQSLWPSLLMDVGVRGGVAPLEFLRPLEHKRTQALRVSKLLDLAFELSANIPVASQLHLSFGGVVSGFFLSSDMAERIPVAPLSTYWQFKEGLNVSMTAFLKVFDSKISFLSGYYPFIQNSSLGGVRQPFTDYGWHLGFCAESTVYRSFGLRFLLDHRRELFDITINDEDIRLSSRGTIAYLGLVGKF